MNEVKKHVVRLFLVLALVITPLVLLGCGSSTGSTSEPSGSAIEPNDSIIFCQIALFLGWDGSFPREMRVYVYESHDVEGFVNYTKDQINKEIDVILDDNLDWLMLGQQINAHVQLRANPEGGSSFYMFGIAH
jgi:hypothetical protein